MRQRMKALQLGINYGMGVPSLAKGLDRHPLIASGIIERHKRRYPRAWQYRNDRVQAAMLDRRMETNSVGRCTSARARTSGRSSIFRCKATAPKCCGWRLGVSARPASSRAC